MDTRVLNYFTRVIETGSISRAARQLGIAQPALSQHVAALEADFGTKLLHRSTRGVTATAAGQQLYRHAQQMLRLLDQAHKATTLAKDTITGSVTLGLTPGTAQSPLPIAVIRQMARRFPGVTLNTHEALSKDLRVSLQDGRIDLAIICGSTNAPSVLLHPLFSEEMRFVGSKNLMAGLDPQRPATCSKINEFDLILPSAGHDLRRLIDHAFAREGLTPHVVHESDSLPMSCLALKSDLGASFLSSGLLAIVGEELGCRDFATIPGIWTNMFLGIATETSASEPARVVSELIIEVVQEMLAANSWPGVTHCRHPAAPLIHAA
jgi:LysR family nitrogen assimilation transcriptional regulator